MLQFEKPDVEQFFKTYIVQNFVVSPDEKQLVFSTNLNGKFNLWAMDLPNQFPYPLTFVDQSCQALQYDKEGRFIIVGYDHDGDENTQIFAIPPQGGTLKPIRLLEGEKHYLASLSKNGERLYYTSSKGNPVFLNSYCYHLLSEQEELLIEGSDAATYLFDVSPEEQSYFYGKHFANTYVLAYVRKDGEDILLTPPTEKQHTVSSGVYVSEDKLYLITNYNEDLSYLAYFNLKTRQFTKLVSKDQEDFNELQYDKNRNLLYIVASRGVEDILYAYDLSSNELTQLELPVSVVEKVQVSESGNLYLLGRSATLPFNIFKRSFEATSWEELTHYRVPGVATDELVEPEVLKYPSFDGLEIEALLFKAKEEVSNGHLILWPHGGPQAAERKMFRALFQFLVNRGYSIFAPNFRGSTGYGLQFKKMVEGDWGHGPRLDNIEGLEWLIKNGYADREKILLMGGSYGGYMTLLLAGRHPEYFKACVDIFGPSNLFTFIESVPDHWKPVMKQWLGDPIEDKERLIVDSPITYLDTMAKPMLVIQGANDPRVVKAESDQIVAALEKKGVDVEYLVLEDEGHGFSKKENEIKVYRKVLEFFDRFI